MALGIGLQTSNGVKAILSFENEGYFIYLSPYFDKIYGITNKLIDLYDSTYFDGKDLLVLLDELEKAKAAVQLEPEHWKIQSGWSPETGHIFYEEVDQRGLLELLRVFIQATREAVDQKGMVLCTGD